MPDDEVASSPEVNLCICWCCFLSFKQFVLLVYKYWVILGLRSLRVTATTTTTTTTTTYYDFN